MSCKIRICGIVLLYLTTIAVELRGQDTPPQKKWEHEAGATLYFFRDDFIFLPTYKGDRERLHLEARYNYEDRNTFSGWLGYNISGGNAFEYTLTPMAGGIIGNLNGLAPGLEITLDFKGFEFYTEMEYFLDLKERDNDYYYSWTDLTYSPLDWLWFGLSAQRTRLYHSDLEIQRGLMAGGGYKRLEMEVYFYNPGTENPYFIMSLAVAF